MPSSYILIQSIFFTIFILCSNGSMSFATSQKTFSLRSQSLFSKYLFINLYIAFQFHSLCFHKKLVFFMSKSFS